MKEREKERRGEGWVIISGPPCSLGKHRACLYPWQQTLSGMRRRGVGRGGGGQHWKTRSERFPFSPSVPPLGINKGMLCNSYLYSRSLSSSPSLSCQAAPHANQVELKMCPFPPFSPFFLISTTQLLAPCPVTLKTVSFLLCLHLFLIKNQRFRV